MGIEGMSAPTLICAPASGWPPRVSRMMQS